MFTLCLLVYCNLVPRLPVSLTINTNKFYYSTIKLEVTKKKMFSNKKTETRRGATCVPISVPLTTFQSSNPSF